MALKPVTRIDADGDLGRTTARRFRATWIVCRKNIHQENPGCTDSQQS
jgi:hypothetical protein